MGKITSTIEFTGKLGNTVGMKGKSGASYIRIRKESIKNPQSAGQCIQRMILATVGTSIAWLKEICNNSVEGKSNGAETLAYLRGVWMRMLRVSNILDGSNPYSYAPKGRNTFTANPYLLSKGTLIAPKVTVHGDSCSFAVADLPSFDGGATPQEYTASDLFPTVAVGDQITLIVVYTDDTIPMGEWGVKYCRFAFKNDVTPALSLDSSGFALNPEAIDLGKAKGDWGKIRFVRVDGVDSIQFADASDHATFINSSEGYIKAGALLVSNIVNKTRSTTYMVMDSDDNETDWAAINAYPTYGPDGTYVDVESEVYLNNSANADSGVVNDVAYCNLPQLIATGTETEVAVTNVPSMPRDCRLSISINGTPFETSNLVGRTTGDAILTVDGHSITMASAVEYDTTTQNFDIYLNNGIEGNPIITSGYVICDGVKYTF